ncbi:hypothetical protein HDU98_001205, partial [Podochytrium sp. JEL0797]
MFEFTSTAVPYDWLLKETSRATTSPFPVSIDTDHMSSDPLTTPISFDSTSFLSVGPNRRMCESSPDHNHGHSSDSHYYHSDNEEKPKRKETRGRKRIERADAESHRKAQNRAAQRAFKERQINHVKELESKVAELTALLAERDPYHVKP